jgi:transcriptional regulator with XRE-family HTH domain
MAVKIHKSLAARFAAKMKQERAEREVSQERMAQILGVSPPYVHMLEHGQRIPSLEMVDQIARKLGYRDAVEILR